MYLRIFFKLLIGFIALLAIVRFLGKKELASTTPLDIVFAVGLGDLIVDAVYDDKVSALHTLVGVFSWSAFIFLADLLSKRYDWFGKLTKGDPEVLIYKGEINKRVMRRNRLSEEEVLSLLRQKDIFEIKEVQLGVIELNGQLSVLKD